jgi:glycosyltransferase 2 family protein
MSLSGSNAPAPPADGGAPDPPPAGGGGPRRWRRHGLVLNVVLLALLVAAILRWVDLRGVWDGLSGLRPVFLIAAVAAALASRFVMGYKWRQLILAAGGRIPLSATISAYFQSVFSGRLMPIGIGGEVLRGWLIARRGVPWGILGGSMAAEKVIAFTSTAILAGVGLLYIVARLPVGAKTPFAAAILAGLGLGALVLTLLLHAPAHERGAALLRHRVPPRIGRVLRTVSDALLGYRSRPSVLATNMLLAALEQSLQILKLYVIGRGVGIEIPVLPFAAALMVLLFVRRIAGYVEGWGLAEGASILTLTVLGVTAELAVSLAVANYAVTTMAALPGAYLLWRSGIGWRGDSALNAAPPARREPPSGVRPAPPGQPLDPRSECRALPASQR